MITPQVKDTKVVFGPCRLSYVHLFEKHAFDGNDANAKYSTAVLIPKSEKETIEALQAAIETAKQQAVVSKWGGKLPKDLHMPLMDGDAVDDDSGAYAGCFYVNAKCSTRPGIVDKHKVPIIDEEEVYSGMWAVVSVNFFGYNSISKGVACGLNNIMKFKDDDRLGGRSSAEADFSGVEFDDDDDL